LTVPIWREANRTAVKIDGVTGVAVDGDGRRCLLVRYGDATDWWTVWVPLAGDGRPEPPFAVLGRDTDDRFPTVSADQQRAVVAAADAGLTHAGDVAPAGAAIVPNAVPGQVCYQGVTQVQWYEGHGQVVVPSERPVDRSQQPGRKLRAAALTPFTVVGDAGLAVASVPLGVAYAVFLVVAFSGHHD
jgi:hypothetical protein